MCCVSFPDTVLTSPSQSSKLCFTNKTFNFSNLSIWLLKCQECYKRCAWKNTLICAKPNTLYTVTLIVFDTIVWNIFWYAYTVIGYTLITLWKCQLWTVRVSTFTWRDPLLAAKKWLLLDAPMQWGKILDQCSAPTFGAKYYSRKFLFRFYLGVVWSCL